MNTTWISLVMYFYMFVCIALLVFSIAYIQGDKIRKKRGEKKTGKWLRELREECQRVEEGAGLSKRHRAKLEQKLGNVQELVSYHEAVLRLMDEMKAGRMQPYLDACLLPFQALAIHYAARPAMEKAYFAHLLAVYHPNRQNGGGQIAEILLRYFEDSTVFSRENTLQALYATGKAGAVVQAMSILNDFGWYHYPRLLSDGMASFPGDKEDLARRLWSRCGAWEESLQVAVVQFITALPGEEFADEFLKAMQNEKTLFETRFALTRYFQRHAVPEAKPALIEMLSAERVDAGGLAITAAAALSRYPGEDSRNALLGALHSRNWYVRRNAASSLAELGATEADVEMLRKKGDRYAAEMLAYMLEARGQGKAPESAAKKNKAEEEKR